MAAAIMRPQRDARQRLGLARREQNTGARAHREPPAASRAGAAVAGAATADRARRRLWRRPRATPPGVQDHDDQEQHDRGGEQRRAVVAGGVAHLEREVRGQRAHRIERRVRQLHGVAGHHDDRHRLADARGPSRGSPPRRCPERAAGRTTRRIVCHWVAPIASEPSRYERGTACSASSEIAMIVGRIITPRITAAGQRRRARPAEVLPDPGQHDDDPHEAVDHRRDAREDLDRRLEDLRARAAAPSRRARSRRRARAARRQPARPP